MAKRFVFDKKRHLAITPTFRLSFPTLFTAKAYRDPDTGKEGNPEFKATMIFDSMESFKEPLPANLKDKALNLSTAISNAKRDFFGPDPKKWPKLDYPIFTKGETHVSKKTGEIYQGYEGKIIASAKTGEKYPPKIVCANGDDANEKTIYGGCYCRAVVSVSPYYFAKKNGVKLYLSQITKVKDGEPFGGFAEIEMDFEGEISETESDGDDDSENEDF